MDLVKSVRDLKEQGLTRNQIANKLHIPFEKVKYLLSCEGKIKENENNVIEDKKQDIITKSNFSEVFNTSVLKGIETQLFDKGDLCNRDYAKNKMKESAVLHLTDSHIGKVNKFNDFVKGKSVETYNFDIFKKELKTLRSGVQEIYGLMSQTYNLEELWIILTGDLIENDRIFRGQQLHVDKCVGQQIWEGVGLFGQFFYSLKPLFKKIHIRGVPGNHGRTTSERSDEPIESNFEYHMYKAWELLFKDDEQIDIKVPDSYIDVVKIYDWNYLILHGNNIKSWGSLPFYGLARAGLQYFTSLVPNIVLSGIVSGHCHQTLELPLAENLSWETSSSWVPKDNYSFDVYKTYPKTTQRFFGVNPKRSKTWSFEIDLQTGQYH
jgi:hypothetical protein